MATKGGTLAMAGQSVSHYRIVETLGAGAGTRTSEREFVGMAGKGVTPEATGFSEIRRPDTSAASVRSVVNLLFAAQEETGK